MKTKGDCFEITKCKSNTDHIGGGFTLVVTKSHKTRLEQQISRCQVNLLTVSPLQT